MTVLELIQELYKMPHNAKVLDNNYDIVNTAQLQSVGESKNVPDMFWDIGYLDEDKQNVVIVVRLY